MRIMQRHLVEHWNWSAFYINMMTVPRREQYSPLRNSNVLKSCIGITDFCFTNLTRHLITDILVLITLEWFFTPKTLQPPVGRSPFIIGATRSHSDTPHSVGFLWTSDRPVAETNTWQHTTLTANPRASGGIRTRNPSKRATVDPCLRPRGCRDRHIWLILEFKF
jgi:hypothetical protein